MKLRIVNKKKFIVSVAFVILLLTGIFTFQSLCFSEGELQYKSVYVTDGDTLWNIAKYEEENNLLYQGKDIRYIIAEIKQVNSLSTSELSIGQKLMIPYV